MWVAKEAGVLADEFAALIPLARAAERYELLLREWIDLHEGQDGPLAGASRVAITESALTEARHEEPGESA